MKRKFTFLLTAALLLTSLVSWGEGYKLPTLYNHTIATAATMQLNIPETNIIAAGATFEESSQTCEDFSNAAMGNTYGTGTFTGQDGSTWSYNLANGTGNVTIRAKKNTDSDYGYLQSGTLTGGCSSLTFDYSKPNSESGNWDISVFINNTEVGIITSAVGDDTFTVNNLEITGNFTIKIVNNSTTTGTSNTKRFRVDNMCWEGYSSGPTQLTAPTNFSATPGNGQASFTWTAVNNAESYTISYTPAGGEEATATGITGTSHTLTGLTNGTEYTCKIKAVGDGTNYTDSEYSDPAITVTPSSTPTCVAPTFTVTGTSTGNADEYYATAQVTLATTTEGASIYYTTNGTDPDGNSTLYAGAFDITETATVKAIAILNGYNNSTIASKAITIVPVSTIAEARALADDATVVTKGVVTYIRDNYAYLEDNTAGIYMNGTGFSSASVGNEVIISGTKTTNNGPRITSAVIKVTTQTSVILPVQAVTIEGLNNDFGATKAYQHERVKITEVLIGATSSYLTSISQDENAINVYLMPSVANVSDTGYYLKEVYAIVGEYDGGIQLNINRGEDLIAYTIDASSNNDSYGTVTANGYLITATPADGYGYADPAYTIVVNDGKIGTVTQTGDEFKVVTNDDDCMVEIQFVSVPTHTVTYMVNGAVVSLEPSVVTEGAAIGTLPTPDAADIPEGYAFRGWSDSPVVSTLLTSNYTPISDVQLYAVFGEPNTYIKVNSLSDITAGKYIISNAGFYLPNTNTGSGNAPTKTGKELPQVTDGTITGTVTDEMIWTFTGTNSAMIITNANGDYLYEISDNNGLRIHKTNDTWAFETHSTGFAMKGASNSRYCATYGAGSDWRSYTTKGHQNYGDGGILYLYKEISSSFFTTIQEIASGQLPRVIEPYTNITITGSVLPYIEGNNVWPVDIPETSRIVIAPDATLNVNSLTNTNPNNLVIEAGGALLHSSDGVQATVKCNIKSLAPPATYTGWNFISSPVTAQDISESQFVEGTYDFYCYDEPSAYWINYKNTDANTGFFAKNGYSDNFTVGRGYMVSYNPGAKDVEKVFSGELNNGTQDAQTLSYTEAAGNFKGCHLVGNPYPSYIDWNNVSLNDNTSRTYYVWNPSTANYGSYVKEARSGSNEIGRYIPPTQGFFVIAESGEGVIQFEQMCRCEYGVSGKDTKADVKIIRAKVLSEGYGSDEIIFEFDHSNFDGAEKWSSMVETAPSLYIPYQGEDYSILLLTGERANSMPFSFEAGIDGNYTISIETETATFNFLQLEDLQTGVKIDLLKENSYSFSATTEDASARFRINFAFVGIDEMENETAIHAYLAGNSLIIPTLTGEAEIQIFDIQGRMINSYSATGSFNRELNLVKGVYVVRIIDESGVRSQKMVF